MDNTINYATTGLVTRQKAMNITSNNLSNSQTVGYKSSKLNSTTFGEYITYRVDKDGLTEIGTKSHGVISDSVYNNFEQGIIFSTGRELDLALDGNGFFSLNGGAFLTRDGRFNVDAEGFLTDSRGNFVDGINGKINIGTSGSVKISESGVVSVNGVDADQILITVPEDNAAIVKISDGMLSNPGQGAAFEGRIIQGSLEQSNVDLVDQMTAMIEDSRAFQSCSQIIKLADQILKKTVNDIGSIR